MTSLPFYALRNAQAPDGVRRAFPNRCGYIRELLSVASLVLSFRTMIDRKKAAAVVYGGAPPNLVAIDGNRALAKRFVTLFLLPEKASVPPR